jgi:hypothetical protein
MPATEGTSRTLLLRAGDRPASIVALLNASLVLAFATGLFLASRRLSGALTEPLPAVQLLATVSCLAIWALLVGRLAEGRRILVWGTLAALLLFAVGCSFPGSRFIDWLAWLPAFGLVVWPVSARHTGANRRLLPPREEIRLAEQEDYSEDVLQQLTRVRLADGKDAVRGTLLAEFAPGQRQTNLYVGFCPPFELQPSVEVSVEGELEADVKLVQVLHNGAQLEVRLSEPAEEPLAISIELYAVES